MKIRFIGAAQTVTGSMHYVETNGTKFLIDCGMYQGKRQESFELNRKLEGISPKEIDFVILTHAHIDHSGNLPSLVRKGFRGKIYSTFATRDLCSIMLRDSAHIQEKDVQFVNKKRTKQKKNLYEPLYTDQDVKETLKLFVALNYHHDFEPAEGITFSYVDAGHILGSACVHLKIKEDGRILNLGFSGDLGRPNLPILRDPEKLPDIDVFVCESTYGGRVHENPKDAETQLTAVINTAVKRKAKIIVPSFSVGRTQELVYALHRIFDRGDAVRIPIYVDSPLSVNATEIFRIHPECFDNEISEYILKHEDPFGFNKLNYIKDVEDSKELNNETGPLMIISSSGMCESGRILHHLANNIENPNNIILIVGYCAENTLGRKIYDKLPFVKILGDEYKLNAEVIVMHSFSAHADSNELINYCNQFDKSTLSKVFLVHGDIEQQNEFKARLELNGFKNVFIPAKGDEFEI